MHFHVFPSRKRFEMVRIYAMRIFTCMMNNVSIRYWTLENLESNLVNRTARSVSYPVSSVFYRRSTPTPATQVVEVKFKVFTKIYFQSIQLVKTRVHSEKYR